MGKLFKPIKIGTMELKNRIVTPPMGTNFSSEEGFVTRRLVNYHVERAKGGVGLIIVEGAYVEPRGKGSVRQLAVDNDDKIPGLKKLATAIQANGAKAALQVFHGGRQSHSSIIGTQPVSASEVFCRLTRETPRALTAEEITEDGVAYEKDGEKQTVEVDSVVLAAGSKPNVSLMKALEGKVAEIYAIGSAKETGNVLEAIHEGSRLAREI